MVDLSIIEAGGSQVLNVVVWIISILFVGGCALGVWFVIRRMKRFGGFRCIIWHVNEEGEIISESSDAGGIFKDGRTGNVLFHFRKNKYACNPDMIERLSILRRGRFGRMGRIIYFLKVGEKDFRPIIPPKFSKDGMKAALGEEDLNFAINAYERSKKVFSQSMLLQILPYAVLVIVSFTILILFIFLFKEFPKNISTASNAMVQAAEALKAASGSSTVIGG